MNISFRRRDRTSQRGSLLITALIFCAIISISLVSYYKLASTALKGASRSMLSFSSIDVVEMGLERAMACFHSVSVGTAAATAWSGWTLNTGTNEATRTFPSGNTTFTIAPNTTAQVKVYAKYYTGSGGTPYMVAKAIITPPDGPTINKWVKVTLSSRGLFSNGLVARNSISWVGHPTADSWNSTTNATYSAAAQAANCTLGAVNGSISLGSGGNVYGYAGTGSSGTTSGGSVHGLGTTTNDSSRISNDFSASFPDVTVPTGTTGFYNITVSDTMPTAFPRASDTTAASDGKYYYVFDATKVMSSSTTIGTAGTPKNVVLIMNNHSGANAISFTGSRSLSIATGSTLTVYTNGNIDVHGNALLNGATAGANPTSACIIYGTATTAGGQSITIGGNGQLYAAVYAPNATVTLQGGGSSGQVLGSVVGNNISMNGGTDFHYDEALANLNTGSGFRITNWKELQSSDERTQYTTQLNF